MNSLERIHDGPLFRALNAAESAMILGGQQETVNTFVRNNDGSLTYVGADLILEPAPVKPATPIEDKVR